MNIENNDKYSVIKPKSTNNFDHFFKELSSEINNFKKNNLIIDLTKLNINTTELNQFSDISEEKQENGTSFVIIINEIDLDLISDEIIAVPSFQEAIDMIEMDEMTRSLDF